jgi:hypothetical protein
MHFGIRRSACDDTKKKQQNTHRNVMQYLNTEQIKKMIKKKKNRNTHTQSKGKMFTMINLNGIYLLFKCNKVSNCNVVVSLELETKDNLHKTFLNIQYVIL